MIQWRGTFLYALWLYTFSGVPVVLCLFGDLTEKQPPSPSGARVISGRNFDGISAVVGRDNSSLNEGIADTSQTFSLFLRLLSEILMCFHKRDFFIRSLRYGVEIVRDKHSRRHFLIIGFYGQQ